MTNDMPDYGDFIIPNGRDGIWSPAHQNNFFTAGQAGLRYNISDGAPRHLGLVLHTPEEDADDNETTPRWFQHPEAGASTIFYGDNDGDLYQMVRASNVAFAQGVRFFGTKRNVNDAAIPDYFNRDEHGSPNIAWDSYEIEGRWESIEETFDLNGPQGDTLCALIAYLSLRYGWPIDEYHVLRHSEINRHKSDPGPAFPMFAVITKARFIRSQGAEKIVEGWPRPRHRFVGATDVETKPEPPEALKGMALINARLTALNEHVDNFSNRLESLEAHSLQTQAMLRSIQSVIREGFEPAGLAGGGGGDVSIEGKGGSLPPKN